MSNAADCLAAVQANYDRASGNEPADLAAAQTVDQARAVQANVALARSLYCEAVAADLSAGTEAAEGAYGAVLATQRAVEAARREAAALPDLLAKLGDATAAAQRLLQSARGSAAGM